MNLTVLLIAAWLPLLPMLFILLRSGSFGKGSIGTLLKLLFLGIAAAVPAFLMEAGALLALTLLFGVFPESAFGGHRILVFALLQCMLITALIEELWKHFILRVTTWEKMTMDTVADGIAAAGVVSAGFSAVLYGFWQAGYVLVPADMEVLRNAMPAFLTAGPVLSFLYAILFIFAHFGFSGFMGALYGVAKGSEQKDHGARAGIMLFLSGLLPVLLHGLCASLIEYGIAGEKMLWAALGLVIQTALALWMASALSSASDAQGVDSGFGENAPVDFADTEEFAEFAEASGQESVPVEMQEEGFAAGETDSGETSGQPEDPSFAQAEGLMEKPEDPSFAQAEDLMEKPEEGSEHVPGDEKQDDGGIIDV